MVITNGFPKSGNHALVKAVQLLGQPCDIAHIPYGETIDGKHIFIKRDPRNVLLSWLRFTGKPVTAGMFITAFRQMDELSSLVERMSKYEGWLTDPNTLIVRYEDLIASDAEMRRIASYIETPYIDGAFEELPGMTMTWYPDHSNYAKFWTNQVDDVWLSEGGPELIARWGY
jgi:hypothetical protein